MLVKGKKRHGLLIDPGAAAGLIGSDTLKDYLDEVVKPAGMMDKVKFNKTDAKMTGISGRSQNAVAKVALPIFLAPGVVGNFHAEVIGGDGITKVGGRRISI